jgi:hypothetical protein
MASSVEGRWPLVAAGIWEILGADVALAPLLIILLGGGVLWQAFFSRAKLKL